MRNWHSTSYITRLFSGIGHTSPICGVAQNLCVLIEHRDRSLSSQQCLKEKIPFGYKHRLLNYLQTIAPQIKTPVPVYQFHYQQKEKYKES